MNIGKFSVSNPVLLNSVWVALFSLGMVSFLRLPRELFSNIDFSWVFIAVPYPGVGAEEIEKNITIKIEDGLKGVDQVKRISSISRNGLGLLQVEFEDGISRRDFEKRFLEVRAEFDKVSLPDGTLDPIIDEFSSADFAPVISVILTGSTDTETLTRTARRLNERLADVGDVSQIDLLGIQEREVWVEADQGRLEAFGVSLQVIADALRARTTTVPGGTLTTGSREYLLQTISALATLDDFESVIVRRHPGGGTIRIGDVATVNRGFADAAFDARYNGQPAVIFNVAKKVRGNSIRVVDGIMDAVDDFRSSLPPQLDIAFFNDTTFFIRDILTTLGWNALSGFVLLVLVLFAFLGLRNALLTAMAVPITFAITFIFMEWSGETFNGNSLFALVLVLGMIVDHAIVIMENSYRHRQLGLDKKEAAIIGTNEVVKPVIAGTLTTVAAFLPLMILPGILGKFMRIIPVVVSLALVASTVEALAFLPVHFADWGGAVHDRDSGIIGRFRSRFGRLTGTVFRHRYIVLFTTLGLIAVSLLLTPTLKRDLFAGEDWTYFFINIEMPQGTPRAVTDSIAARFEDRLIPLIGNGEVLSISTSVGFALTDSDRLTQNNVAQITVDIAERTTGRARPMRIIMGEIEEMIRTIPGPERLTTRMVSGGPPVDKPVSFRIRGDNLDNMATLANEYVAFLRTHPELYNVQSDYVRDIPELRIRVDQERAAALGLSTAWVGLYLRSAFDGIQATTWFENGEEIDVIVKLSRADQSRLENLASLMIPTPPGTMVPFSSVASIEQASGILSIRRADGKREIRVEADADDKRTIPAILQQVERMFTERYTNAYPDISLRLEGEFAMFDELLGDILRLLWVGILLIYIILGAQFKSYLQPFIMIFTIFFALVGCILFLALSRTPVSVVVLFAGVALVGISVNDSIVLISFINSLRRKGMALHDAVVEAGKTRLRPILLTSITTIGGLSPMALGIGGKSPTWSPMASTIIFGLIFSTAGTLLVIPSAYGVLNDLLERLGFTMQLEGE